MAAGDDRGGENPWNHSESDIFLSRDKRKRGIDWVFTFHGLPSSPNRHYFRL